MSDSIGKPRTESYPAAKLTAVGAYLDVAICKVDWDRQMTEIGTGRPLSKPDGSPRKEDIVTAIVIRHTGAAKLVRDAAGNGTDVPLEEGEVVSLWLAGMRRFDWMKAQPSGYDLKVGDIMRCTFTGTKPGNYASPIKLWSFQLRHAHPDEAGLVARCREIAAGPAPSLGQSDEDPF